MKKRKPLSLRMRLLLTILMCWVLPILIVLSLAGVLVGQNYENSLRQELDTVAGNALEQVQLRLELLFESSKAVSYDGVVRNSYRYERSGDSSALYKSINEYINQNFTRDDKIAAIFISFRELPDIKPLPPLRGVFSLCTGHSSPQITPKILPLSVPERWTATHRTATSGWISIAFPQPDPDSAFSTTAKT